MVIFIGSLVGILMLKTLDRRNILARGLYRSFTNKEWKAGEKPEEKSLKSPLTYFKGDYVEKEDPGRNFV